MAFLIQINLQADIPHLQLTMIAVVQAMSDE
jgi:hypothetical protein